MYTHLLPPCLKLLIKYISVIDHYFNKANINTVFTQNNRQIKTKSYQYYPALAMFALATFVIVFPRRGNYQISSLILKQR